MSAFEGTADIHVMSAQYWRAQTIERGREHRETIMDPTSNRLLKVHAPFWPEAFLYIGRAIDLARVAHALHQSILAPACVGLWRCRFCCWREAGWDDLLWLTNPAHPADACTALLHGDESAVRPAANAANRTPSIGIS